MSKKVSIAGAGLVGSLLSIYMARKGYQVDVYERRPDMREADISAGKSINLALSDRGLKALAGAGIEDEIREMAIPMKGRMMHDVEGNLTWQSYGKEDQAILSISRGGLNAKLMDLAEAYDNVNLHFNHKCTGIDLDENIAQFEDKNGDAVSAGSDLIFGSDGAFSAVRSVLQKTDRFNYQQEYIAHGYKELSIPASADGTHLIEKNALHIWPRGKFMLIALPNLDGSFTCTLFLPYEDEKYGFNQLNSDAAVKNFFETMFADAIQYMPDYIEQFNTNPTSSLCIIRCFPWTYNSKVALIGDASHAIVPFYGQGMNAGFEDCTILHQFMEQYGEDWPKILSEYEQERKPNADAIADLAMQNFVEMRDLTADPDFLLQKKIERAFADKHPNLWMPLYSQVTFSHIPYAEALERGKKQERIMKKVMSMSKIAERWQHDEVMEMMYMMATNTD